MGWKTDRLSNCYASNGKFLSEYKICKFYNPEIKGGEDKVFEGFICNSEDAEDGEEISPLVTQETFKSIADFMRPHLYEEDNFDDTWIIEEKNCPTTLIKDGRFKEDMKLIHVGGEMCWVLKKGEE
tara:strand:+ start:110 stop:487 length:378 start_codon:yes stop_codon:yes gene_type:complete